MNGAGELRQIICPVSEFAGLKNTFIFTRTFLSQTSGNLVKPRTHQLSNPGPSELFFFSKSSSATSNFSSESHPEKIFEKILILSSAYVFRLGKPVCVYMRYLNRGLSQTVKSPSDSNKRNKLLMKNPRKLFEK